MMLVEIFGDVCRLTEFASNPKRAHFVSDPRQRKRMRNLRAHTVDDLMILDCNDAPETGLHRSADCFEIDPIDEWIIDHGGGHALLVELLARFDCFDEERTTTNQHDVAAALEHLRPAPFIFGVLGP